jgi:hypothetical protein
MLTLSLSSTHTKKKPNLLLHCANFFKEKQPRKQRISYARNSKGAWKVRYDKLQRKEDVSETGYTKGMF